MADWAEVWTVFIPISILLFFDVDKVKIRPIHIYFISALILNLLIDASWIYSTELLDRGFDFWLIRDNNVLYNFQSVIRVILFTIFLWGFLPTTYRKILKVGLVFYGSVILVNFIFLESPLQFSSRLFSAESLILLTVCILYFITVLNLDSIFSFRKQPAIWIAIGLSLYEASNFSIFLFYSILVNHAKNFAVNVWYFHNLFFGVLCIFCAKAFYESRRN